LFRESLRRNVVKDLQARKVEPFGLCFQQSNVHIFVFASQKYLSFSADGGQVTPDFCRNCAGQYSVSTHENSRIVLIEADDLVSRLNVTNHTAVLSRKPRRWVDFPPRNVGTSDKIHVPSCKGVLDSLVP